MQDCKDGSELQFIKFDFLTGGQEIKSANLVKLFVAFTTLGVFVFQFQDNEASLKKAPGHDHENTIFRPRQRPFKEE